MKILQHIPLSYPAKTLSTANHRIYSNEKDVFIPTTSVQSPSFKANTQNIYKKILENPTLSQKFMSLVSVAAASLIAYAQLGNKKEKDEIIDFQNMFQEALKDGHKTNQVQLEKELEECKEENSKLKQKLNDLLAQINFLNSSSKNDNNSTLHHDEEIQEIKKNNCRKFEFPKKRGRLSERQKNLKEIANNLELSEVSLEQLKFICEKALQKGVLDDKKLEEFSNKLSTDKDKELVIQAFYEDLIALSATNEDAPTLNKDCESELIIEDDEVLKNMGVKVVGKIDADKLQTKSKDGISLIPIKSDKNEYTFMFKADLVRQPNVVKIISKLISRYQKQIYTDFKLKEISTDTDHVDKRSPKWKYKQRIPSYIQPKDIKLEIDKAELNHNQYGSSKYQNFSKISPEELAGIINSDERYHELFTIHGALRFIDRYIDFDSDVDIEIQSMKILDELYKVIQQSIKTGVVVNSYVSEGYYAPKIKISCDNFDENSRKIFGNRDLYISLAEAQITSRYVPSHNKNGLICTIFSR